MGYFTYIILCSDNKYYVGFITDKITKAPADRLNSLARGESSKGKTGNNMSIATLSMLIF